MNLTRQLLVLLALGSFIYSAPAFAEDQKPADADKAAVAQCSEEIKAEIAALRKELQGLRGEMQQVLAQLKELKKTQKAQPRKKREKPAMKMLGQNAPTADFKTNTDQAMKLGGKSDKIQVVCFYASWCGFCKRALPGFERLHKDYSEKGVDVIAINLDAREGKRGKSEQDIIDHYNSLKLTLPMSMDPASAIGRQYKVSSFPTSFVIGKNGVVEAVHVGGPVDLDKQIAAELDQLLEGKSLLKKDDGKGRLPVTIQKKSN